MGQTPPLAGLRLLLLEDDAELRDAILAPALAALGLEVLAAGSVAEWRLAVGAGELHVAVLDVHLPDGNGFAVANELRHERPQAGVILLTRHTQPAWQVAGFHAGADVYLPKPVQVEVLCAAVQSLAGRLHLGFPPGHARLPPWTLAEAGWKLQAPDGRRVDLNAAERMVLERLFAEPGTVIERETLLAGLGQLDGSSQPAEPHRLDMLIYRLRRKIEAARLPELPLRTVRGRGYVLAHDARSGACQGPGAVQPGDGAGSTR